MAKGLNVFVSIGAKLLPSLNSSVGAVERRFGQMGRSLRLVAAEAKVALKQMNAASSGLAGMAAAGGLTFGVTKAIGQGATLQHELQMLRNIGLTSTEVAGAMKQANQTIAALPTTSLVDNLRAVREGVGAFGDYKHAIENLTFNQKVGSMMKNMLGGEFDASHAIASGIRALEIRGTAMDQRKYQAEMGELYKSMVFFGERFSPEEIGSFSKTGNIPLKGYNIRFLSRILPSIIQEMGGGDTVGTMASAFRNQIMGRVPLGGKKLTEEWVRLGLVPKPGMGGNLSRTGWTAGTVKGHALAMTDPFRWIEAVLLPAMKAHGVNTGDTNAVATQISKMFGRETAIRFVATMADPRQRYRLRRDEANIDKVHGVDATYDETTRRDPTLAWEAIKSSFTNLSAAVFGTSTKESPIAVAMVNIAKGINTVAFALERHPTIAKGVAGVLLGGAGLATLRLFTMTLKWAFSPLRGIIGLASSLGGAMWRALGPALFRGILTAGTFMRAGVARLGVMFLESMAALAPVVGEGVAAAFALISNPVGWTILAVAAAVAATVLIYKFRDQIGAWLSATWESIKGFFTSLDWASIGTAIATSIADALSFGLASRMPQVAVGMKGWWSANAPTWMGGTPAPVPAPATAPVPGGAVSKPRVLQFPGGKGMPAISGARAAGGPVGAGRTYLVGEKGPEVLEMGGRSGNIIPNSELVRRREQRASGDIHVHGGIHINGAANPRETEQAVYRALHRMAGGQAMLLSD